MSHAGQTSFLGHHSLDKHQVKNEPVPFEPLEQLIFVNSYLLKTISSFLSFVTNLKRNHICLINRL